MQQRLPIVASLLVAGLVWIALAIIAASGNGEVRPSIDAGGMFGKLAQQTSELEKALREVVAVGPALAEQVSSSVKTILVGVPGQRTPESQLVVIALTLAGLIIVPMLLRRLLVRWLVPSLNSEMPPVFELLISDAVTIAVIFIAGFVTTRLLFPADTPLDRLAVGLVWGAVRWWIAIRVLDIVLRPAWPQARLITASDQGARAAARLGAIALGLGIWFISIAPVLLGGGLKAPSARALAMAVGLLEGLIALLALRALFSAPPRPPLWVRITLRCVFIAIVAIWLVSVLALEFSTYHTVVFCLQALGGAFILERLLVVGSGELVKEYATAARRVIWLSSFVAALFGLARLVLVQVFHVVQPETWAIAQRGYTNAFVMLAIGFVMFEGLKAWTAVRFGAVLAPLTPGDEQSSKPISRFATVMPMAVGFAGAIILVTSVILALSELGVSIGPLLAGVSIIGLAFSFGSQALVRDIVSGMFYMVDDAFRIGEYIDTGRHKGTVEKISLRSLRLRHQNGQFHNVPYGQFGAVTNFSRDWMTLKFNLRMARTVDVNLVRKLTKKLGQQLLEHPEIGPEFLVPLKLQGLTDIQENALILRFKFTVKPAEPSIVRREVMNELFQMFRANGIAFAEHAVTVHAADPDRLSDGGAASSLQRAGGKPDGEMIALPSPLVTSA